MNVDPASLDGALVAQYASASRAQDVTGFVLDIIPTTVVDAFARGDILQVLVVLGALRHGGACHRRARRRHRRRHRHAVGTVCSALSGSS